MQIKFAWYFTPNESQILGAVDIPLCPYLAAISTISPCTFFFLERTFGYQSQPGHSNRPFLADLEIWTSVSTYSLLYNQPILEFGSSPGHFFGEQLMSHLTFTFVPMAHVQNPQPLGQTESFESLLQSSFPSLVLPHPHLPYSQLTQSGIYNDNLKAENAEAVSALFLPKAELFGKFLIRNKRSWGFI